MIGDIDVEAIDIYEDLGLLEPVTRRDTIKASLRAREVWEQQVLRGGDPRCRVCGCTDDVGGTLAGRRDAVR